MKYYYRVTDNERFFKINAPSDYNDSERLPVDELVYNFSCEIVGVPDAIFLKGSSYVLSPQIWINGVGDNRRDVTRILMSGGLVLNWVRKNKNKLKGGKELKDTDKKWIADNKGKQTVTITHEDIGSGSMYIGFWFDDREASRIYNNRVRWSARPFAETMSQYLEGVQVELVDLNIATEVERPNSLVDLGAVTEEDK